MLSTIQYITDAAGNKTSVIVPIDEWDAVSRDAKEANRAKRELEILIGIREALEEVKEAKRTGRELPLVRDLLNESLD